MLKVLVPFLAASIITIISIFSGSVPLQAATKRPELRVNQRSAEEINKVIRNIQDKDPQKIISQKLSKNQQNPEELESNQSDNLQIKFNPKNKKVKLVNKSKGEVNLKISDQNKFDSIDIFDDKVIYSGPNSQTEVMVEAVEGGVRQVVNIKDATAPDLYDFPIELDKGDKLELTENGGAIIIGNNPSSNSKIDIQNLPKEMDKKTRELIKSNQIVKTTIGKPWAKDANGKNLKTNYSIENGNILRQKIDLTGAVFPVVADPIWCGNAISSVSWINRNGVWSASNYPTNCGAWNCTGQWGCWYESWEKTSKYGYQGYNIVYVWDKNANYASMYNQFYCHTDFARGIKTPWNLEPSKADKGYWGFANFRDQCN